MMEDQQNSMSDDKGQEMCSECEFLSSSEKQLSTAVSTSDVLKITRTVYDWFMSRTEDIFIPRPLIPWVTEQPFYSALVSFLKQVSSKIWTNSSLRGNDDFETAVLCEEMISKLPYNVSPAFNDILRSFAQMALLDIRFRDSNKAQAQLSLISSMMENVKGGAIKAQGLQCFINSVLQVLERFLADLDGKQSNNPVANQGDSDPSDKDAEALYKNLSKALDILCRFSQQNIRDVDWDKLADALMRNTIGRNIQSSEPNNFSLSLMHEIIAKSVALLVSLRRKDGMSYAPPDKICSFLTGWLFIDVDYVGFERHDLLDHFLNIMKIHVRKDPSINEAWASCSDTFLNKSNLFSDPISYQKTLASALDFQLRYIQLFCQQFKPHSFCQAARIVAVELHRSKQNSAIIKVVDVFYSIVKNGLPSLLRGAIPPQQQPAMQNASQIPQGNAVPGAAPGAVGPKQRQYAQMPPGQTAGMYPNQPTMMRQQQPTGQPQSQIPMQTPQDRQQQMMKQGQVPQQIPQQAQGPVQQQRTPLQPAEVQDVEYSMRYLANSAIGTLEMWNEGLLKSIEEAEAEEEKSEEGVEKKKQSTQKDQIFRVNYYLIQGIISLISECTAQATRRTQAQYQQMQAQAQAQFQKMPGQPQQGPANPPVIHPFRRDRNAIADEQMVTRAINAIFDCLTIFLSKKFNYDGVYPLLRDTARFLLSRHPYQEAVKKSADSLFALVQAIRTSVNEQQAQHGKENQFGIADLLSETLKYYQEIVAKRAPGSEVFLFNFKVLLGALYSRCILNVTDRGDWQAAGGKGTRKDAANVYVVGKIKFCGTPLGGEEGEKEEKELQKRAGFLFDLHNLLKALYDKYRELAAELSNLCIDMALSLIRECTEHCADANWSYYIKTITICFQIAELNSSKDSRPGSSKETRLRQIIPGLRHFLHKIDYMQRVVRGNSFSDYLDVVMSIPAKLTVWKPLALDLMPHIVQVLSVEDQDIPKYSKFIYKAAALIGYFADNCDSPASFETMFGTYKDILLHRLEQCASQCNRLSAARPPSSGARGEAMKMEDVLKALTLALGKVSSAFRDSLKKTVTESVGFTPSHKEEASDALRVVVQWNTNGSEVKTEESSSMEDDKDDFVKEGRDNKPFVLRLGMQVEVLKRHIKKVIEKKFDFSSFIKPSYVRFLRNVLTLFLQIQPIPTSDVKEYIHSLSLPAEMEEKRGLLSFSEETSSVRTTEEQYVVQLQSFESALFGFLICASEPNQEEETLVFRKKLLRHLMFLILDEYYHKSHKRADAITAETIANAFLFLSTVTNFNEDQVSVLLKEMIDPLSLFVENAEEGERVKEWFLNIVLEKLELRAQKPRWQQQMNCLKSIRAMISAFGHRWASSHARDILDAVAVALREIARDYLDPIPSTAAVALYDSLSSLLFCETDDCDEFLLAGRRAFAEKLVDWLSDETYALRTIAAASLDVLESKFGRPLDAIEELGVRSRVEAFCDAAAGEEATKARLAGLEAGETGLLGFLTHVLVRWPSLLCTPQRERLVGHVEDSSLKMLSNVKPPVVQAVALLEFFAASLRAKEWDNRSKPETIARILLVNAMPLAKIKYGMAQTQQKPTMNPQQPQQTPQQQQQQMQIQAEQQRQQEAKFRMKITLSDEEAIFYGKVEETAARAMAAVSPILSKYLSGPDVLTTFPDLRNTIAMASKGDIPHSLALALSALPRSQAALAINNALSFETLLAKHKQCESYLAKSKQMDMFSSPTLVTALARGLASTYSPSSTTTAASPVVTTSVGSAAAGGAPLSQPGDQRPLAALLVSVANIGGTHSHMSPDLTKALSDAISAFPSGTLKSDCRLFIGGSGIPGTEQAHHDFNKRFFYALTHLAVKSEHISTKSREEVGMALCDLLDIYLSSALNPKPPAPAPQQQQQPPQQPQQPQQTMQGQISQQQQQMINQRNEKEMRFSNMNNANKLLESLACLVKTEWCLPPNVFSSVIRAWNALVPRCFEAGDNRTKRGPNSPMEEAGFVELQMCCLRSAAEVMVAKITKDPKDFDTLFRLYVACAKPMPSPIPVLNKIVDIVIEKYSSEEQFAVVDRIVDDYITAKETPQTRVQPTTQMRYGQTEPDEHPFLLLSADVSSIQQDPDLRDFPVVRTIVREFLGPVIEKGKNFMTKELRNKLTRTFISLSRTLDDGQVLLACQMMQQESTCGGEQTYSDLLTYAVDVLKSKFRSFVQDALRLCATMSSQQQRAELLKFTVDLITVQFKDLPPSDLNPALDKLVPCLVQPESQPFLSALVAELVKGAATGGVEMKTVTNALYIIIRYPSSFFLCADIILPFLLQSLNMMCRSHTIRLNSFVIQIILEWARIISRPNTIKTWRQPQSAGEKQHEKTFGFTTAPKLEPVKKEWCCEPVHYDNMQEYSSTGESVLSDPVKEAMEKAHDNPELLSLVDNAVKGAYKGLLSLFKTWAVMVRDLISEYEASNKRMSLQQMLPNIRHSFDNLFSVVKHIRTTQYCWPKLCAEVLKEEIPTLFEFVLNPAPPRKATHCEMSFLPSVLYFLVGVLSEEQFGQDVFSAVQDLIKYSVKSIGPFVDWLVFFIKSLPTNNSVVPFILALFEDTVHNYQQLCSLFFERRPASKEQQDDQAAQMFVEPFCKALVVKPDIASIQQQQQQQQNPGMRPGQPQGQRQGSAPAGVAGGNTDRSLVALIEMIIDIYRKLKQTIFNCMHELIPFAPSVVDSVLEKTSGSMKFTIYNDVELLFVKVVLERLDYLYAHNRKVIDDVANSLLMGLASSGKQGGIDPRKLRDYPNKFMSIAFTAFTALSKRPPLPPPPPAKPDDQNDSSTEHNSASSSDSLDLATSSGGLLPSGLMPHSERPNNVAASVKAKSGTGIDVSFDDVLPENKLFYVPPKIMLGFIDQSKPSALIPVDEYEKSVFPVLQNVVAGLRTLEDSKAAEKVDLIELRCLLFTGRDDMIHEEIVKILTKRFGGKNPRERLRKLLGLDTERMQTNIQFEVPLECILRMLDCPTKVKLYHEHARMQDLRVPGVSNVVKVVDDEEAKKDMNDESEAEKIFREENEFISSLDDLKMDEFIKSLVGVYSHLPEKPQALWEDTLQSIWSASTPKERQELSEVIEKKLVNRHVTEHFIRTYGTSDGYGRSSSPAVSFIQALYNLAPTIDLSMDCLFYIAQTFGAWHTAINWIGRKPHSREGLYLVGLMYRLIHENDHRYASIRDAFSGCAYENELSESITLQQQFDFNTARRRCMGVMNDMVKGAGRRGEPTAEEADFVERSWVECSNNLWQWELAQEYAKLRKLSYLRLDMAWRLGFEDNFHQYAQSTKVPPQNLLALLQRCHDEIITEHRRSFPATPNQNNGANPAVPVVREDPAKGRPDKQQSTIDTIQSEIMKGIFRSSSMLPKYSAHSRTYVQGMFSAFVDSIDSLKFIRGLADLRAKSHQQGRGQQELRERTDTFERIFRQWRGRIPNLWEDMELWNNQFCWRLFFCSVLYRPEPDWNNPSNREWGISICRERSWDYLAMCRCFLARNMPSTCLYVMQKILSVGKFLSVPEEVEAIILHSKCESLSGNLAQAYDILRNYPPEGHTDAQNSRFAACRASVLLASNQEEEALAEVSSAIRLNNCNTSAWSTWGKICLRAISQISSCHAPVNELPRWITSNTMEEITDSARLVEFWSEQALTCFLQALRYLTSDPYQKLFPSSRQKPASVYVTRILSILAQFPPGSTVANRFKSSYDIVPSWVWVPWLPHLVASLGDPCLGPVAQMLILEAAKTHPSSTIVWLALAESTANEACSSLPPASVSEVSSGQQKTQSPVPLVVPTQQQEVETVSFPALPQDATSTSVTYPSIVSPVPGQQIDRPPTVSSPSSSSSVVSDERQGIVSPSVSLPFAQRSSSSRLVSLPSAARGLRVALAARYPVLARKLLFIGSEIISRLLPTALQRAALCFQTAALRCADALSSPSCLSKAIDSIKSAVSALPQGSTLASEASSVFEPHYPALSDSDPSTARAAAKTCLVLCSRWYVKLVQSMETKKTSHALWRVSPGLAAAELGREVEVPCQESVEGDLNATRGGVRLERAYPEVFEGSAANEWRRVVGFVGSDGRTYFYQVCERQDAKDTVWVAHTLLAAQTHRMLAALFAESPFTRPRGLVLDLPNCVPVTGSVMLVNLHLETYSMWEIYENWCRATVRKNVNVVKPDPDSMTDEDNDMNVDESDPKGAPQLDLLLTATSDKSDALTKMTRIQNMVPSTVLRNFILRKSSTVEDLFETTRSFGASIAIQCVLDTILDTKPCSMRQVLAVPLQKSLRIIGQRPPLGVVPASESHPKDVISLEEPHLRLSPNIREMFSSPGDFGTLRTAITSTILALHAKKNKIKALMDPFYDAQYGLSMLMPDVTSLSAEQVAQLETRQQYRERNARDAMNRFKTCLCDSENKGIFTDEILKADKNVDRIINAAMSNDNFSSHLPSWFPWV